MIPIMSLLNKFKSKGSNVVSTNPSIVCTAFEVNNGVIEIENVPKIRAYTKHINLVYHHFREHVIQKRMVLSLLTRLLKWPTSLQTVIF